MTRGTQISLGAHALLMLWMLLGNVFRADPPDLQVAEVSVISEAEFAALSTPRPVPDAAPEPAPEQPAPPPEPAPEPEPVPQPPEPAPEPAPEPPPEPAPPPPPEPQPVAPPPPPEPVPPPPEAVPAPEPVPQVFAPQSSLRPKPRPAERVAATPVPPPPEEAAPGVVEQQAAEAEAESPDLAEVELEQTAPQEAAPEIVTEAEEPASSAPAASLRPRTRPERVAEAAQTREEPAPQRPAEQAPSAAAAEDAVAAALAEALAGGASSAPEGPPLTRGEREGLRLAVQACWVVDVGSQAADVTVVVGFDMERDGTVVSSSLRMLDATGGSGAAVETAYNAARRAILRCQDNFDLPEDKYDSWKRIEMTFNPSEMRLR